MFTFSKNDVYKTRCFLYNYNQQNYRLVRVKSCREPGFEEINKTKKDTFVDVNSEEVQRCSLSRTKREIREICLCNDFEYFCTFTVNSQLADRYSLDIVQEKIRKILHKIKRRNKDFAFVLITEKHKDGAFHFHGLCKNIDDLYINENGYYCSRIFKLELGFNSFSKIKDYAKCCNYITKYITKDCIKNSHNQIYFCSRGLKRADKIEIENIDFEASFSNDFCDILDFDITKISRDDLMKYCYIKEIN